MSALGFSMFLIASSTYAGTVTCTGALAPPTYNINGILSTGPVSDGPVTGSISACPALVVTASGSQGGDGSHGVLASAVYYFAVSGTSGTTVTVLVDGYLATAASAANLGFGFQEAQADATLDVQSRLGHFIATSESVASPGQTKSNSWSGTLRVPVLVDDINSVTLDASLYLLSVSGGSAYADPHIYIDPATPNASAFSLLMSPGVGNALASTAAPEPSTWSLTLSCVAAGLVAGRRMRRSRASQ